MRFSIRIGESVWHIERESQFCLGYPIHSSIFVCPVCTTIWASSGFEGDDIYVPQMVSCEDCTWKGLPGQIPGTILHNDCISQSATDVDLIHALPEDLLRREFHLHIKANT